MEVAALFEEKIDIERGHGRATIRVELGGDGQVQVAFEGRDGPTMIYRFSDPNDASAIGEALIRAADVARGSAQMEAG